MNENTFKVVMFGIGFAVGAVLIGTIAGVVNAESSGDRQRANERSVRAMAGLEQQNREITKLNLELTEQLKQREIFNREREAVEREQQIIIRESTEIVSGLSIKSDDFGKKLWRLVEIFKRLKEISRDK